MASKPSGLRQPASGIKPPAATPASATPAVTSTSSTPGTMSRIPSSSSMKRRQVGPGGDVGGFEIGSQVSKDSGLAADSDNFIVGDIVYVNGDADKRGKICYIGEVAFAAGEFAGIALEKPAGKHDGQVKGHRYFQCSDNHGVFTKLNRVFREPMRSPQMSETDGPASRVAAATPGRFQSPGPSPSISQTMISPSERTPSPFGSKVTTPGGLQIGERVIVSSATGGTKMGILRYLGPTDFAAGQWCGVELDKGHPGKNDGSVGGKRYFNCEDNRGLFVPISKVMASPMNRGSLRRHGSRESLASISSLASSVASRSTKRVSSQRHQCLPSCSMQAVLKEKENHVEHLLKERELDRVEMVNVARKLEECSQEFRSAKEALEKSKTESAAEIEKLQLSLDEERRKYEDLQYSLDEERVSKSELASQIESLAQRASSDKSNTSEIERLSANLLQANNSIKDLNDALGGKIKALEAAEAAIIPLRSDNETLKLSLAKAQEDLKEKDIVIDESSGRAEEIKNFAKEKEDSELKLRASIEELRSQQSDSKAQMSKYEEQINQLKREKLDLQSEIKDILAQQDTSSGVLSQKLESSNSELGELKSKIEALSKEITEHKTNITTMASNEKTLSAELERQNACNSALETSLAEKVKELTSAQEKYKREISELLNANEAKISSLTEQLNHGNLQSSEAHSALDDIRKQKDKLFSDNLALGTVKADLESELQTLRSELEVLRNNNSAMKTQLVEQNACNSALETSLAEKVKELTSAQEKYKREISELQNANEAKISSLTEQLNHGNLQSSEAHSALDDIRKQKDKLFSDNLALGTVKADLESELQTLRSELEVLRNNNSALETQLVEQKKSHGADYHKLLQTYKESVAQSNDLKAKITILETDVESKETLHNAAVAEIGKKEVDIQTLSKTVEDLKAKCEQLEGNVQARSSNLTDLENHVRTTEKKIEDLTSEKQRVDGLVVDLENTIASMKSRAEKAELGGRDFQASLESTKAKLTATEEVMENLKKAYDESCNMINALEDEKRSAETKISQMELDLKNRTSDIQKNQNDATKIAEDLQQVKQELISRDQVISSLEDQVKAAKKETAMRATDLQESVKKLTEYEKQLELQSSDRSKLKAEFTFKEEKIDELEQNVVQLKLHTAYLEKKIEEKNKAISDFQSKLDAATSKPTDPSDKDSQINFLNSIIVDLQQKNQDLNTKVDVLLHGSSKTSKSSPVPAPVTLRLYCDICEKFDLHDTEDCPTQASEVQEGHQGEKPIGERPYCDSCEMFGHRTEDCDDGETF